MANTPTNQKKSDQKSNALLKKMTTLLHSPTMDDVEDTKREAKSLVYREKDKRTLTDLKTTRSKKYEDMAKQATAIAGECSKLRAMYEEFRKQAGDMSNKEYDEKRDVFLKEIRSKQDTLKSFWDVLRTKYNEVSKFEEKIRKNAKTLKGAPEEFQRKVGFPIDDAKRKASTLTLRGKHLIKIGVQIRRAEMELEFR